MTYKEAIEYLQPVADNTPLTGYGAALEAAIYALHQMEEVYAKMVRCKDCRWANDDGCAEGFCWCEKWNIGRMDLESCSEVERRGDND